MLQLLLAVLCAASLVYISLLISAAIRQRAYPGVEATLLGAITNFFDTLGIGSFAPTMAWFKFRSLVSDDRLIAPTMLAGHTLPTFAQAIIFLILLGVHVDPVLLISCVIAIGLGAVTGVRLVSRAPISVVRLIVGVALIIAAMSYAASNLGWMPGGGTAGALPLPGMIAAIAVNFLCGILFNFGIGNNAPILIALSLLGMDPRLVFPIIAAGGAIGGGVAGTGHIRLGKINMRLAGGIALGGIPAVLLAAFLVQAMPIAALRWLVIVVVLYAALIMIRSALRGQGAPMPGAAAAIEG